MQKRSYYYVKGGRPIGWRQKGGGHHSVAVPHQVVAAVAVPHCRQRVMPSARGTAHGSLMARQAPPNPQACSP